MSSLSSIHHLYAFDDGDTITPAMGIKIDAGFAASQYWNPTTKKVVATDFSKHNLTLFPQAYSSKKAEIIVPEAEGQQWYYNNISDVAAILDSDGSVKDAFKDRFQAGSVSMNGKTFPALIIIGNLANETDHTDKYIYYSGTYDGRQITCQQLIPIQSAVGDAYKLILSVEGEDGSGDNVLSNDNDWVKHTAYLQIAGNTIASDVNYSFDKLVNGTWTTITNTAGLTEVSGNSLKVFNAAVEGVELFRAVAVYNGKTYYLPFEVTDVHDPYYIDDGCSIPGDSVPVNTTVTFSPKVLDRSSGDDVTTSMGWTFSYTITSRKTSEVITDFDVNSLTSDNIKSVGGVAVRIDATR